jgi:hypothetical protein
MEVYEKGIQVYGDDRSLALIARLAVSEIAGDPITGEGSRLSDEANFIRKPQKAEWMRWLVTFDDRMNLFVYHTPDQLVDVPPADGVERPATTEFHARLFVANGNYAEHQELVDGILNPYFEIVPLPEGQPAISPR